MRFSWASTRYRAVGPLSLGAFGRLVFDHSVSAGTLLYSERTVSVYRLGALASLDWVFAQIKLSIGGVQLSNQGAQPLGQVEATVDWRVARSFSLGTFIEAVVHREPALTRRWCGTERHLAPPPINVRIRA